MAHNFKSKMSVYFSKSCIQYRENQKNLSVMKNSDTKKCIAVNSFDDM